jgi:thiol-disulfide isomerase/thioredoxin
LRVSRLIIICLLASAALGSPGHAADATVDFGLFDEIRALGEAGGSPAPPDEGILLLQFWASWCHSCGSLMWDMDDIVSSNDGVSYLAVSLDDDADAAARYIRKHKLYSKYRDRYFVDGDKALSASLGIETVPSILVVAPSGDVLLHKSGHLNSTDLRDIVGAIRQQP